MTDDFNLDTEHRIYLEGLRLSNEGDFFEAHETWEEAWSQVRDPRRERFYRALIQGAVTLELLRRGRAIGVRQVFVSCGQLFEGLPPVFMGLDIAEFLDRLHHAIAPTGAHWMAPKAGSCRLPKRRARELAQTGISSDTMI